MNNLITTHNLNNIKENDKNQAETKKTVKDLDNKNEADNPEINDAM